MNPVSVAFVWHQHQPYYRDDLAGENPMPWVRLHGTKDYWGMAMHLAEVPEMRATINLAPSLVAQILGYTDHGHEDMHLRVSRLPADSLSEADMAYLLDNFFMVNPEQMVRPFRRYHELYQQRGLGVDSALTAAKRFAPRDVLDLQCWNNLAWIHPIAFEIDKELAAFRDKGGRWTEAEKQWLLERQMQMLAEVIPLHRKLAERGQVELTTTPFYHPILPLLIDKRSARQAMPHVNLPHRMESYAEDAAAQIKKAVAYHEKVFGMPPQGMWPSEGSVSQAVIAPIAAAGIRWIATDEEILAASTDGRVSRDPQGFVREPHMLYRPWRVSDRGESLEMVFRDHALSDQIGFHYQRYGAEQAAGDMIGELEAIGRATGSNPTLVSIILDGENCWEYYPNGGVEFLRSLYRRIASHGGISPVRVGDYIEKHPATDKINHLAAGSWISHNFGIWLGHPECNRAWDLVSQTREYLVKIAAASGKSAAQLERAWEELFIAEGSDWFWWFGDSHSSSQDGLFDELFRKHLQNVYLALGEQPPTELTHPIRMSQQHLRAYSEPTSLLDVKINGRQTYFEWLNAGQYLVSGSRGTMSMADDRWLESVYFGFDAQRFYLRLDARGGAVRERLANLDGVRIVFDEPAGFELLVKQPATAQPALQWSYHGRTLIPKGIEAAADEILEIAIAWRSLSAAAESPIHFHVELVEGGQSIERDPPHGSIETAVPSPNFELMMWQA